LASLARHSHQKHCAVITNDGNDGIVGTRRRYAPRLVYLSIGSTAFASGSGISALKGLGRSLGYVSWLNEPK
jgi:hypothetical protein